MANTVEIIFKAIDQASGPVNKFSASFEKLTGISLSAAGAIAGVGIVVDKTVKFIKESIDETQIYNLEITKLAENLNITTEETSRLIQTADDFGVEMSSIESAMKLALKNGFAPSIETLAKMADRYREIQDPTERATELTKVFGRNWSELVPLLKQGGDVIRAAAAAQSDALVVTREEALASERLRVAQDGLNDSKEALAQTIGNKLIPAEAAWMKGINSLMGGGGYFETVKTFYDDLNPKLNDNIELNWRAVNATDEQRAAYARMAQTYTTETKSAYVAVSDFNAAGAANLQYYQDATKYIPPVVEDVVDLGDATLAVNQAMQTYSTQLLFNKAAANLTADAAFLLAEKMGLVDDRTVYATEKLADLNRFYDKNKDGIIDATEANADYLRSLDELNGKLNNLPKNIDINVNVRTNGSVGYSGEGAGRRAAGGPVFPGGSYMVGEAGPEMLYMGASGGMVQPITNNNNYNLTVNTQARSENIRADFAQMQAMG